MYEFLLGGGVFALFFRAQLFAFIKGFYVSVMNSTKVNGYYIMRNRATDNVFFVSVVAEKLFFSSGCHVEHFFTKWVEKISWGQYDDYTFMAVPPRQLEEIKSGNLAFFERLANKDKLAFSDKDSLEFE